VVKKGGWTDDTGDGSPFAALGALRDALPPAPASPKAPEPAKPSALSPVPKRAVVRIEKKGRGGKEVTLVEQLGLDPVEMSSWATAMKKALGCGGAIEGDTIALQGDVRDRAVAWLTTRGVRKISK